MFAAYKPSRIAQPWEDWEEALLWDDCRAGCEPRVMALRLRRTEDEVEARMKDLGLKSRKAPPT
jgi:hypothetical protein